jgi:hypothetical protein
MTTTKIKNSANVLWTTKSQYVQWYHINEGMPKVEAAAKWSVDSVNPDIERYMDGDELRIALQAIPTTTAGIGRGVKREIATTEDMMTMDQFKTARARLKTENMVSIGDPMFQDTRNSVFKGAASSSTKATAAVSHLITEKSVDDNVGSVSLNLVKQAALVIDDSQTNDVIGTAPTSTTPASAPEQRTICIVESRHSVMTWVKSMAL